MLKYFYHFAAITVPKGLPQTEGTDTLIQSILKIIFTVLGSIALLMVMIGAYKYTISQGDPQSVKSAKDTIMYSVIGLIVAISAWTLVTYALQGLFS